VFYSASWNALATYPLSLGHLSHIYWRHDLIRTMQAFCIHRAKPYGVGSSVDAIDWRLHNLKTAVFGRWTPYNMVDRHKRFGGYCYLHFQGTGIGAKVSEEFLPPSSGWKSAHFEDRWVLLFYTQNRGADSLRTKLRDVAFLRDSNLATSRPRDRLSSMSFFHRFCDSSDANVWIEPRSRSQATPSTSFRFIIH
jgi:hypothetical protein